LIRRGLLAAVVLAAAVTQGRAEDPARRDELAAIKQRLVALDLEGAQAAVSRFLQTPGLTDDERADALALRAGVHVAAGDLGAVEADYRAVLALRPDFVPEPALTSKKSMERLARLRASMIGTVRLDLDPKDARLTIDGKPVTAKAGSLQVLAGERRLHAERSGFDPVDLTVRAVAGAETLLEVRLVPNARGIVVRTDIPGVAVVVDGARAGETAKAGGGAELLVPDLPIGEHAIELSKPCFATETVPALVSVDLADRTPKPLAVVTMRPAASRITATGADYKGELRVDGEALSSLPATSFNICPGPRTIEVVASRRVVWSGTIEAEETDRTLDLSPRPNVALVGDEWPEAWKDFAGAVSLRGRIDPGARDLSTPAGWRDLKLPSDTDLAVGVRGARLPGERPRVWVYGPATGAFAETSSTPPPARPTWAGSRVDAELVDHDGGVAVAGVKSGGAAERVGLASGDRIIAVSGKDVATVEAVRRHLDALPPGSPVSLRVISPGKEARTVSPTLLADPRITVPEDPVDAILRGAWAAAEGAAGGPDAASALANLAVALEAEGRAAASVEAWRRAKTLDPATFGLRADYAVAVDLASRGKRAEAKDLFRRVRESAEPSGDIAIGAAAGDRLADLGVTP
jgi:PDZ domain-containing protein